MRQIDKSRVLPPEILSAENGAGAKEKNRALEFYTRLKEAQQQSVANGALDINNAATPKKGKRKLENVFKFKVYGDKEVRQAIGQLFENKCAYCESRYAGTQPVDVEHWRPKGMINTEAGVEIYPGYYWLASDWENLLASCIDCNRRREQRLEPGGEMRVVGKGNRFPLASGSKHATEPGAELDEVPLLLNPYTDNPEQHLEFLPEGVVRSKLTQTNEPSAKGDWSIDVYALNRTGLVQDRKEVMLLIQQRMFTIQRLANLLEEIDNEEHKESIEDLLSHELKALARFCNSDRPFSMMARSLVNDFIAKLTQPKSQS